MTILMPQLAYAIPEGSDASSGQALYVSSEPPEGIIRAAPGSLCVDTVNSLLYIKTGGHYAIGWGTVVGGDGTPVTWADIVGAPSSNPDLVAEIDAQATAAVATHEAGGNVHPIYLTQDEANALYDALGAASAAAVAAIAAHEAASDPHPQYLTPGEADAAYQDTDPTLDALAALNASAGLLEQTAADTFTKRAIGIGAPTSIPSLADADARYAPISGGGGGNSYFPSGWA